MMHEPGKNSDMVFEILKPAIGRDCAARLGRFAIPRRQVIETPNFISLTSRGAIPHLTPDVLQRHVHPVGAYLALEDFVEKSHKTTPPILRIPTSPTVKALHAFTSLPLDTLTILAPRRAVAVRPPNGNGKSTMSIFTSTGFQNLTNHVYVSALESIQPDIAIPMVDLTYSERPPVAKKQLRMAERTEDWLVEFFKEIDDMDQTLEDMGTRIFAPVLPVEHSMQWEYISRLEEEFAARLSGLAVTDVNILPDIQRDCPEIAKLPRLSIMPLPTPHHLLRQLNLGVDLVTMPFLNQVSDSGVAMTYTFAPPPRPSSTTTLLPLGINIWDNHHQRSLSPLVEGCPCYTCRTHHRAFVHHLLHAHEMLAWVLLQVHNHHVASTFFASVRETLAQGADKWEQQCREFSQAYEPEFPEGTGERPRARGYHFKSQGGDAPINKKPWEKLDVGEYSPGPGAGTGVGVEKSVGGEEKTEQLVDRTATETPLVPDPNMDAKDLDERGIGFAVTEK